MVGRVRLINMAASNTDFAAILACAWSQPFCARAMMLMMMVTIMMMAVPCEFYSFCGLKGPLSGIQLTASPPLCARLIGALSSMLFPARLTVDRWLVGGGGG